MGLLRKNRENGWMSDAEGECLAWDDDAAGAKVQLYFWVRN